MKLLMDIFKICWFLTNDSKLNSNTRTVLENPRNERWLSPIGLMEIALKVRIRKLPLPASFSVMFPALLNLNNILLLPLETQHIEPLTTLPLHRKDPFDRLIAATALVEALTLVSADAAFDAYGVSRLW